MHGDRYDLLCSGSSVGSPLSIKRPFTGVGQKPSEQHGGVEASRIEVVLD